jgi:hypothetical protein
MPKAKATPKAKAKASTKVKPKAKVATKAKAKPKAKVAASAKAKPKAKVASKAKVKAKPIARVTAPAVRYAPEAGASAGLWVQVNLTTSPPDVSGFVLNESYTGCSLAIPSMATLKQGDQCMAKVGSLNAMPATVVWRRDEGDFSEVGLRYDI